MTSHLRNTDYSWGSLSKLLHWLTASLILIAIILGLTANAWPLSPTKLELFVWHKSIGISILLITCLRLLWKWSNKPPLSAKGISSFNGKIAQIGHYALYLLLLALPISGWLLNSAANFPFKWFGWLEVPSLIQPNETYQQLMVQVHYSLFIILSGIVVGHAIAAIWHHYHQSNALIRMLPSTPQRFFITLSLVSTLVPAMIIVAIWQGNNTTNHTTIHKTLPTTTSSNASVQTNTSTTSASDKEIENHSTVTTPAWLIEKDNSQITFIASYAGVDFQGIFHNFTADILFEADQLEQSQFTASIDLNSVDTESGDRDAMLPTEEWFSTELQPHALFKTLSIKKDSTSDIHYLAVGELSIKGITNTVTLRFSWEPQNVINSSKEEVKVYAETELNRVDFNIGSGSWINDETIGFNVKVEIHLSLYRQ